MPIKRLGRKEVRDFLDWVYDRAIAVEGTNPSRTANKAREHLRAVISWPWEQDLIDSLPNDIQCRRGQPAWRAVERVLQALVEVRCRQISQRLETISPVVPLAELPAKPLPPNLAASCGA